MRAQGLVFALLGSLSALALAQESPQTPAENPAAKQATDLAVKKGLEWITRQQCMTCHFKVPNEKVSSLAFDAEGKRLFTLFKHLPIERRPESHFATLVRGSCTRDADKKEQVTYLGVTLTAVPPVVRRHVTLPVEMGLLVESVDAGSPAQTAGLAQHDLLLKIDEQLLVNPEQFTVLIRTFKAGADVRLTAIQQNEHRVLTAKLAQREIAAVDSTRQTLYELHFTNVDAGQHLAVVDALGQDFDAKDPEQGKPAAEPPPPRKKSITYLGVHTSPPSEALARQLKLAPGLGLIIDSVEESTAAAKAGLKPFDILQKLDEQLIVNKEQFTVLIRAHKAGDEVQLTLIREGKTQVISTALGQHEIEVAANEALDEEVVRFWDVQQSGKLNWRRSQLDDARWFADWQTGGRYETLQDAEFLRRVYLDLTGTVPRPEEVKTFTDDASKDKRQRLVDQLVARPEAITRASGSTALKWSDATHDLSLVSKEGSRHFRAVDIGSGKILFEGPVDTDQQRQALPAELADKLGVMLKSQVDRQARPASVQETLERILPKVELADVPLKRAIEQLRDETGVNLVVNWKALKQAGVNADEAMTLSLRDVRLSTALTTLLSLAGDEKARLGYTVEGEVILVSVKGR